MVSTVSPTLLAMRKKCEGGSCMNRERKPGLDEKGDWLVETCPAWGYILSIHLIGGLSIFRTRRGERRLGRVILGRLVVRLKACGACKWD